MFFKRKSKEFPDEVDRVTAFSNIYDEVYDTLQLADLAEKKYTRLYDIYYDEGSAGFYALAIRDGIVYKIEVLTTADGGITIGEFHELQLKPQTEKGQFRVYRSSAGDMRWLSIASVAVMNRIGEIDSRELFDSFVDYANKTNNFPVLNIYHLGENSTVGQGDFLARHNYVYIAGGKFNNDKFGKATYEGLQGRTDWGNSIEFYSPRYYIEQFNIEGEVLHVPVYKRGINTGITLVREKDAASMFTLHKVRG